MGGSPVELTDFTVQIDSLDARHEFALTAMGAYNGEPFNVKSTMADAGQSAPWDHIDLSLNLAMAGAHTDIVGTVATNQAAGDALVQANVTVKYPVLGR